MISLQLLRGVSSKFLYPEHRLWLASNRNAFRYADSFKRCLSTYNFTGSILPNSTDLRYSCFPQESLFEICKALNFPDIKYVTTATLSPERVFYHCCLNAIQTRMRVEALGEVERGLAIADTADKMFDATIQFFRQAIKNGKLVEMPNTLEEKHLILRDFISRMICSQTYQEWSQEIFDTIWPTNKHRYRFQTNAIETYRLINKRIASGEYFPKAGWDAEKLTRFWGERNLEYKHYRDIGRQLVGQYFDEKVSIGDQLTYFSTTKRKGIIIFGPMGCGKSVFSRVYLEHKSNQEKYDMVHHDADCLKLALSRSAIREGVIQESNGSEVQNESSNALYEGARQRHYYAVTKGEGPNVIINSICANSLEMDEILEGGGHLELHHISTDLKKTVVACEERAKEIGRNPSPTNIGWSNVVSAKSLVSLTKYIGANVTTFVYERDFYTPQLIAVMDCRSKMITVYDMVAFKRVGARANLGSNEHESGELFHHLLVDGGFSFNIAPLKNWMIDHDDPARMEIVSRAKKLGITDCLQKVSHELGEIKLKDGRIVLAHVIHAVDAILTDGEHLVMIKRKNAPGIGKLALPGGFLDPKEEGGIETPVQGALREVLEEAFEGIQISLSEGQLVGRRNMNRPFDVRVARGDRLKEKYNICDGDIFMVSTQAIVFHFPALENTQLMAGDDALPGTACKIKIGSIIKDDMGVADHFDMIREAFSEKFQNI